VALTRTRSAPWSGSWTRTPPWHRSGTGRPAASRLVETAGGRVASGRRRAPAPSLRTEIALRRSTCSELTVDAAASPQRAEPVAGKPDLRSGQGRRRQAPTARCAVSAGHDGPTTGIRSRVREKAMGAGRGASGTADPGPGRDPDPGPLRQAKCGTDLPQGFGFHPLGCWLDRGDGTGEALAVILRPGNAGANTTQDRLDVLVMALLAPPQAAAGPADPGPSRLPRRDPRLQRRAGPPQPCVFDRVRLGPARPASAPRAARAGLQARPGPRRAPRRGACTADLSDLDLAAAGWVAGGTRAICRRGRPHPGAAHKLAFSDQAGHRFQVFITNHPTPNRPSWRSVTAPLPRRRPHPRRPCRAAWVGRAGPTRVWTLLGSLRLTPWPHKRW
jgi:hypothetical protein